MAKNVYCNLLRAFIVWVIIGGIQGHPSRRMKDQRSVAHNVPTPEAMLSDRSEPEPLVRDSLDVNHESHIRHPVTNARRNIQSDGKIVFPSDLPCSVHQNYTPPSANKCTNATFCENPPDYPSDLIKNGLKLRHDLKYLATIDTAPEIGQRIDADNDVPLCLYEEKIIFPKSAESKDNEWLYIVNEEDFPQGVRIEECMTENTACSVIEGFSEGYRTTCKQKYVYRQLAAVSTSGLLDKNYFRFASSCCCHVKFTGNPAARIGAFIGSSKANLQSPAPRMTASRAGETENK